MAKKRNKKRVQEDPCVVQARHKRDYISRLKLVSDQLVGAGWFDILPDADINLIYEKRYPPIIIKPAPGQTLNEKRWAYYHKGIVLLLDEKMPSIGGGQIPRRTMLSEGLCLLHFIELMGVDRFSGSERLREAFKPFLLSSQSNYKVITDEFFFLLFLIDVRNGNYYDGFMLADSTQINVNKIPLTSNTIYVYLHRPVKTNMLIDGGKRQITPLCRPAPHNMTLQVAIKPSAIGFETADDEPLQLYIQQHALQRLDERLGLLPDIVHGHLFFTLFQQPVTYVKENDYSLIAFTIHEHKVGYLLANLHDDKLLIHSFLFLTNDGTPEGRRLRKLTQLGKHDKKFLEIDKLSTFNAYHIEKDEALSALFREAGCGSLLEAGYMETISTAYTPGRDTAALRRYLSSSSYFENLG